MAQRTVMIGAATVGVIVMLAGGVAAGDDLRVIVSDPVTPAVSPPARSLPPAQDEGLWGREINPRENPHEHDRDQGRRGTWDRTDVPVDPLAPLGVNRGVAASPAPQFTFESTPNGFGGSPPDINGDVGPNHYVHMVNVMFTIYDKAGNEVQAARDFNDLFTGAGGNCESQNAGDPIVVYDELADRWLLSQFAGPTHMCIAVSQTPDPTGSYNLYEFNVGSFPDYFKFGVWPDGYYMSANEDSYTAYAFDRAAMLAGSPATFQKFSGQANLLLPRTSTAPPRRRRAPRLCFTPSRTTRTTAAGPTGSSSSRSTSTG